MSLDTTSPITNEHAPNIAEKMREAEAVLGALTLTTRGAFAKEVADKLISAGLAKKVRLEDKNIFQLNKLAKRYPALRMAVAAEVAERSTRVERQNELKKALKKMRENA